jgi:cytoskeletal protein CcmA (bactofilin family)
VDGELSADAVHEVESHLAGCQSCRALILALREEGMAIADTVLDRHRELSRAPARARARGLAIGLVPTLGVAALVVTTFGWLMQILPPGAGWLNPVNLIGVYEVTFDTLFTLRDRAPALFDFTIWIGRNVSAAVIIIFLVTALGKRVVETVAPVALLGCLWALLLASPQAASALELRTGEEDMQVAAGETIEETLLISGETVTIDGTIDGDLAAFAERVVLRGLVRGNVFAAGREVEVLGTIEGSLHVAGERVTIEGKVAQSVFGAAQTLTLHERGEVGRDAVLFGEAVHVDGRLGRDLFSAAERVAIRGSVGRDASTRGNRLALLDGASVAGDLYYELEEGGEPDVAPGARVGGETSAGEPTLDVEAGSRWLDGGFYLGLAVFGVSAFLVGMLLHQLLPSLFYVDLERSSDFFRALGYGAVALIGTPIALVLCFITVVGIPIGVIGVFLYLTSLFVSVVAVAGLVGTSATATLGFESGATRFGISLLVGLVLVLIAMNLPWVGGILRLLVILTGLGLLSEAALRGWQGRGERFENL